MKVSLGEIVATVLREQGDTKTAAEAKARSVETLVDNALAEGNDVIIGTAGALYTKEISARIGRDPRTGAALDLDARNTIRFRGFKAFRTRLNG